MPQESLRLSLPDPLHQEIAWMLDLQFWLFGCDIKHPQGNLLIELGFERTRPPEGLSGSTQYQARIADGVLKLWGFGFWYKTINDSQGVFLRRHEFDPRLYTLSKPIWRIEDLPPSQFPATVAQIAYTWECLSRVFDWFANYEEEILQRCGESYRKQCLIQWTKHRVDRSQDLLEWWRRCAQVCKLLLINLRIVA